ncbi:protein crossbronx homolog [Dendroctonus ponderosae]
MFSPAKNDSSKSEPGGSFARQGSLRRVIPPETDRDNLFGRQNEDLNNIFKIYRQEYIILAEYKMIQTEDIQGVYVIPSRENPLMWFGVIFARSGPYKDGVFRFTLFLDDSFPDCEHPKVLFHSKLLHPVINPETNELNLSGAFPTWNKNEQHLWQVLKYIQWIFINVEASLKHSINKEASELLLKNKEAFSARAQELVELNKKHLYDSPPTEDKHYIAFEPFNPELHKKENMMAFLQEKGQRGKAGYSWVLPRRFKPLERPITPPLDNGVEDST